MYRKLYVAVLFALVSFWTAAQKIPLIHSGQVIEKGKILYDSGDYAEAIKEFFKVPERDTNYVLMLTEAALAYLGAGQYDEVLSLCKKGLSRPTQFAPYFLRYEAIAQDKKGNLDESIRIFQAAIKKYPTDYGLLYNLGITYYNNGQHEKAADIFFSVLTINPFHAGSHLNLGRIAIGQGRKVHGMMSMGMYLGIANTDNARLVLLNNFLDNQVTDEGSIPPFGLNEAEKLDQIIRAKIAMDKNFKSRFPVDAAVVRQFEMFFQQLSTIGNDTEDPWVKMYLPVYRAIIDNNLTEAFLYHLLVSSPNQSVKKWVSKNEKTLNSFYGAVNAALEKHREIVSLESFGFQKPVQAWYNDDNIVTALGEFTSAEIRVGHWKFFYTNHQLSAEGDFDERGKKTGLWKYYNNDGTLKSQEDHATGEVTAFYRDGTKREHFYLKDEAIDGEVELFYPCGPLKEKLLYRHDNRHGKGQRFHATGQVQMTYEYSDDKAIGEFRTYYADGTLKLVENYKAGELDGDYRSYFPDKKTEEQGQYLSGRTVGHWKHYYSNGQVSREGNYSNEGQPLGEWLYYDEPGNLTEKRQFDEEGRRHGLNSHYFNNKLHYTDTYKKGVLIQSVYYDESGKEIAKHGNGEGTFDARNYFATGQLHSEGSYRKGKYHGLWKTYNRFGKLISEYHYAEGLLQGKGVEYYASGEKKYDLEYKDDELHGYFVEYYRHGQIKQEGWFQNGKREQQWVSYFADGTTETDGYYLLNSLTGPYYTYAQDGKLYSLADYKDEMLDDIKYFDKKGNSAIVKKMSDHAQLYEERYSNKKLKGKFEMLCGEYINEFTRWYPDGVIYYSYTFLNGKKNGPYVFNHVNGKRAREGLFINDVEEGLWTSYHPNGKVSKQGRYVNGLQDSIWNFYFPDGKTSSYITYRKGEPTGVSRYYSPEGAPLIEKMYLNGDLLAWRVINENEENSAWQVFSGTATISVKNPGGQVIFEENYRDGLRDGHKRLYFNNGKLHEEYHFAHGDFDGAFVTYYADGKIRERGTYKNDELHGKVEAFNPDGTLLISEQYSMGSRHGTASYFTKSGKKEYSFRDGTIE